MPRSPLSLSRHRTFRWNDGQSVERYDAVETCDEGLIWYGWSHAPADGGRRDAAPQTFEHFRAHGPLRAAPPHVVTALRAWIEENV